MSLTALRRWILPNVADLVAPDGIPPLVASVMAARGIEAGDMADFIAARAVENGPPMLDLDRAVERLRRAPAARARTLRPCRHHIDRPPRAARPVRALPPRRAAAAA